MKIHNLIIPFTFFIASYSNAEENKILENNIEKIIKKYHFQRLDENLNPNRFLLEKFYRENLYETFYFNNFNIEWKCEKLEIKLKEYEFLENRKFGIRLSGNIRCEPIKNKYKFGLQFKLKD